MSLLKLRNAGTMLGLLACLAPPACSAVSVPAIVPKPAQMTMTPNAAPFALTAATRILVTPGKGTHAAASFLSAWIKEDTGLTLPVKAIAKVNPAFQNVIVVTDKGANTTQGNEGYTLSVTSKAVSIVAPHGAGLFYGGETLRQLLPLAKGAAPQASLSIPALNITDQPRFPERSLLLDSARHYQSIAYIKRTFDLLAFEKINTFHWHLSDDQGWRLEIKQYPKLTSVGAYRTDFGKPYGAYYTQAQVRGLVAYAAARHIVIIPEIEMPAHCISLLAAYPENACFPRAFKVATTRIAPDVPGTPDVLCAGREATYTFMENVLTEVMALFPSQQIHIGGDECPTDRWKVCPVCQAKIKHLGLKDEHALQNYFTHRIALFLTAHGRHLQGWNEIMDGGDLPQDVVVEAWNRPQATTAAVRAGNDVVVASTHYAYFDYPISRFPLRNVYRWNPMPPGLTPLEASKIKGLEACMWTEQRPGDAEADKFIWPRMIAVAEVGWTPFALQDWSDFSTRLRSGHYARLAKIGMGDPAQTDPAVIESTLTERSTFDMGTKIGGWEPAQMSQTFVLRDWNVTQFLTGPGMYTLRLEYDTGAKGIDASEVDIMKNGTEVVAKDVHVSFAGGRSHDEQYALNLPALDPAATYTVRVHLRSDGPDSHGSLFLEHVPTGH